MKRLHCSDSLHSTAQHLASYAMVVAFFSLICAVTAVQADEPEKSDKEKTTKKVEKRIELRVEIDDDGKVTMSGTEDGEELDTAKIETMIEGHLGGIEDLKGLKGLKSLEGLGDGNQFKLMTQVMAHGDVPEDLLKQIKRMETVNADGEIRVFALGDGALGNSQLGKRIKILRANDGDEEKFLWVSDAAAQSGRYRLGVLLEEPGEAVRAQLGLDDNEGLMVGQVMDGSPAEEIGLKRFDVLTKVGGTKIRTAGTEELIRAIEAAGDAGKELSITFIRRGERKRKSFVPMETQTSSAEDDRDGADESENDADDDDEDDNLWTTDEEGDQDIEIEFRTEDGRKMRAKVERARDQAKRARERYSRRSRSDDSVENLRKEVQELRELIEEMKEAIKEDD